MQVATQLTLNSAAIRLKHEKDEQRTVKMPGYVEEEKTERQRP